MFCKILSSYGGFKLISLITHKAPKGAFFSVVRKGVADKTRAPGGARAWEPGGAALYAVLSILFPVLPLQ